MSKLIKTLSLLLMLVFVFAACQTAEVEIVPEYEIVSDTANFGGTTFNWGFSMNRYASDTDNVFGYKPTTNFADMALERQKEVEKKFNCVIKIDNNSSSYVIGDRLSKSLATGTYFYDIATCDTGILAPMVRARGYLAGLSSLLDVQNTEKFGRPNMVQMMLWQDDLYGVVPAAWPILISSRIGHVLAVNENIVTRLGEPDPREYAENKVWTWDKFEEVVESFTYTEGDTTIYGLSANPTYFAMNIFLSNGVTFSEYVDGKVVCGAYTEAGKVALDRAGQMFNVTCRDFIDDGNNSNFLTGTAVMNVAFLNSVTDRFIYEMDDVVGIIPFPQGPNATPGVYPTYYEEFTYGTVIPSTATDVNASAMIIDAMFEPFKGYETREKMIEYLTEQVFFDPRDSEVFLGAVEYTEYGYFWEGGRNAMEQSVKTFKSATEILEGLESVYEELTEEYLVPYYNARVAVYGE